MRNPGKSAIIFWLVICLTGCTRVVVKKDPGPHDKGFRFWRPKPYLFIGPAAPEQQKSDANPSAVQGGSNTRTSSQEGSGARSSGRRDGGEEGEDERDSGQITPTEKGPVKKVTTKNDRVQGDKLGLVGGETGEGESLFTKVIIDIKYLLDYNEEYSVKLNPGIGTGTLNFTLRDGWNLTSVGQQTNQEIPELLTAIASIIGAVKPGGAGPTAKAKTPGPPGSTTQYPELLAETRRDVPLGFYEPVVAIDDNGCKTLLGWRYVGFMPFAGCPVTPHVHNLPVTCDPTQIWGLVISSSGSLKFDTLDHLGRGVTHVDRSCNEYVPATKKGDTLTTPPIQCHSSPACAHSLTDQ